MYINKTILIGNITKEIELKALPSGNKVASFSLATNRTYKDAQGQKQESVEFHNVVSFGKQAETIAQYCKKGDGIYVEGRLQTRNYEKDEVKHYRTEIVLENFQFGKKAEPKAEPKQDNIAGGGYPESMSAGNEEIDLSSIPF